MPHFWTSAFNEFPIDTTLRRFYCLLQVLGELRSQQLSYILLHFVTSQMHLRQLAEIDFSLKAWNECTKNAFVLYKIIQIIKSLYERLLLPFLVTRNNSLSCTK